MTEQLASDADGAGSRREISGIATKLVVSCVRQWGGEQALAEVLALTGEARPLDELEDERTWVPYPYFCRLLHAAAQVLGDPEVPRRIGEAALERKVGVTVRMLLRALGSPELVYRSIHRTAPKVATMATARCLRADRRSAVVLTRLDEGSPPDEAYRDFAVGLLAVVPSLFGLPATSVQRHVAADGREWTVTISWPSAQRRGRRALHFQMEAERREKVELADRLQTLQHTVADLVSPDGIEAVLARIAGRSAFAVQAQETVLAVRLEAGADPLVYADGLSDARAQQVGRALLEGRVEDSPSTLVVEVASARRRYGWFLASNPSGHEFLEGERQLLEAYASLSAAALDSATALEEARSQGTTARELLGLARTLASFTDAAPVASALARALTTLAGAERGMVFLWDPQTQSMRLEASAGTPEELERQTHGLRVTHRDTPELAAFLAEPGLRIYERGTVTDPFIAELLDTFDSVRSAVVPLIGGGDLLGALAASWGVPRPAALGSDFQQRLEGLADQGATALRNARLVERMRQQALYDGLTGLPNRTLLADRVALALDRSAQLGTRVAVVFCDLDDFKTVNDSLGHAAGDQLLVTVAQRIRHALRPADIPARLGGDEFAVLLEDVSEEAVERIAARLLTDITEPVVIDGWPVRISASVGIAFRTPELAVVDRLLDAADAAMYEAKRAGKNRAAVFAPGMREQALRRLALATDLTEAVARGELRLVYQPIVRVADGEAIGMEASVRWDHPGHGPVSPAELVPVAEQAGSMLPLGRWVLEEACRQAVRTGRGDGEYLVSVDVSEQQLHDPTFAELVAGALDGSGLPARQLLLEISESALVGARLRPHDPIAALRGLGVRLAVADFGAGGSSVSPLLDIRPDIVKIDARFVREAVADSQATALLEAVLRLAASVDARAVAEGVERPEELAVLRALGCPYAQGLLFCPPVPADELHASPVSDQASIDA